MKVIIICALTIGIMSCNPLEKNEIARINFKLEGDFGQEYSTLSFFRIRDSIMAKYEVEDPGKGRKEVMLGQQALIDLSHFLKELKNVKTSGYCTTVIHCSVITKDESIKKKNIDCRWAGYQRLKESLLIDSIK